MFSGGIADKLGNRYEALWLVRKLLDVIRSTAHSIQFEGIDPKFKGFEFALSRNELREWHQTKINSSNGNWTFNALKREGVIDAFDARLSASESDECYFISQDPAKDLRTLTDKSRLATDVHEFKDAIAKGDLETFDFIKSDWKVDDITCFHRLRRAYFQTESQHAISSAVEAFSALIFREPPLSVFSILRDFMESHINVLLTTDDIRSRLREDGRLSFKDWALEKTLRERLAAETRAYLDTYIPFGADGAVISRRETKQLIDYIKYQKTPSIILLEGVAGVGKSGIIREFIGFLYNNNIDTLSFRIDQYLDCTSPQILGERITGRHESPATTLAGIADGKTSVLIIDQIDAVSEVSGRNGAVKRSLLQICDEVLQYGRVLLLIACRTFDLENDPRFKALVESNGVAKISVSPLSWEIDVQPLLETKHIDHNVMTVIQKTLLLSPLNLSIFFDVFRDTSSTFETRSELFRKLMDSKGRRVREVYFPNWSIEAPLSVLSGWMSESQRLDAPDSILSNFSGATDILSSEGLIVRSRGTINFFHESFFDFIYARTFSHRQGSLTDLLLSSEQHLFRRTQARQILEVLRQIDYMRYLRELRETLSDSRVRLHVKIALAQWIGSLGDPGSEEADLILSFDEGGKSFPQIMRLAIFTSSTWFKLLADRGWVAEALSKGESEREQAVLWWLASVAGQYPDQVARMMDEWWGGNENRGNQLLNWFGLVKRAAPDQALVKLLCRVLKSVPSNLFPGRRGGSDATLLFHTWARNVPLGATDVVQAYFDAWYLAHPNHHPFERDEFSEHDSHSLSELASQQPLQFILGTLPTFKRAVEEISARNAPGTVVDYTFTRRVRTGHHFGADAFLKLLRDALATTAMRDPLFVTKCLLQINPVTHEVFTHIWLEVISVDVASFDPIIPMLLPSQFLFNSGWEGAKWLSFAKFAKSIFERPNSPHVDTLERLIVTHKPELAFAARILRKIRIGEADSRFFDKKTAAHYVSISGYEQWCILQTIGEKHLSSILNSILQLLTRKFAKSSVAKPQHMEATWIGSPIQREKAEKMDDAQWLRAIQRYDQDDDERSVQTMLTGGARQLAQELRSQTIKQPLRFAKLSARIPPAANPYYVGQILSGLAEANDLPSDLLADVILAAHSCPNRPFGSEIARAIEKHQAVIEERGILDILLWYVENGEASEDDLANETATSREMTRISDLLGQQERLYLRGINGARGYAAETLGSVVWSYQKLVPAVWSIVEQRARTEPLVSVKCCFTRPLIRLFNDDPGRCADTLLQLSLPPKSDLNLAQRASPFFWQKLAITKRSSIPYLTSIRLKLAFTLEKCVRKTVNREKAEKISRSLSPLVTHNGTYLIPFILRRRVTAAPSIVSRMVLLGNSTVRAIGAWHIFRASFEDVDYIPLGKKFAGEGALYRRLEAGLAAEAITIKEYRYVAEAKLKEYFDDEDDTVRKEASEVFRSIAPDEVQYFRNLADDFISSRAFSGDAWAFFNALDKATCRVDDILARATEKLLEDIEKRGNARGRRSLDLHQVQETIKKEYGNSELYPDIRTKLLDLLDRMLLLEIHGVDALVVVNDR